MKVQKQLRKITTPVLTVGAGLILGFLSFSGMFFLWPVVSFAIAAFVLSVVIDGLIYHENIKRALKKFKPNHLKRQFAQEFLLDYLPSLESDTEAFDAAPDFFKDYLCQLKLYQAFTHDRLDEESSLSKKLMEKRLSDMEKWFTAQLFLKRKKADPTVHIMHSINENNIPPKNSVVFLEITQQFLKIDDQGMRHLLTPDKLTSFPTLYELKLQHFLKPHQNAYQEALTERKETFRLIQAGSMLSALFMIFAATYLLGEPFLNIPLLASLPVATLPFIILPMAIIAGLAYGLLTYNASADMTQDKSFFKRKDRVKQDLKKLDWKRIPMSLLTVGLFILSAALTLCNVGTWWTIVTKARPLFSWMAKIPSFVILLMSATLAWSAGIFNLQNILTTMNELDVSSEDKKIEKEEEGEKENIWQKINPFRILLYLTYEPLRLLVFIAHLISESVNSDQVPGLSALWSFGLSFGSNAFEDWHYISGYHPPHKHDIHSLLTERFSSESEHDHNNDIPTRALRALFYPLYYLAAIWHVETSKIGQEDGKPTMSFERALEYQQGLKPEKTIMPKDTGPSPSRDWEKQHMLYLIEKKQKNIAPFAIKKQAELETFKKDLRVIDFEENQEELETLFHNEMTKEIYNTNTYTPTFFPSTSTSTASFIRELPLRTMGHAPIKKKSQFDYAGCFTKNCCPPVAPEIPAEFGPFAGLCAPSIRTQ